ncbi:fimbrial protein [Salmonella enterica subsp. enterica serovar Minnesota]|uniref:F4 family fimbrial subunit n=1 Tax=Salmonella enterica TaxID=28901 RepID=UPI001D4946C0|nr:fimbrial protein [Salmonella enterica subsp. enterica serovar Minnesota]HDC2285058.1 fimbrial protein [Salmonella enterica]EHN3973985.1 fimbrial protein [Salmonella enterica subsp. enterica serovar Minnesota]EHN3983327.1 fimbrial protein [Salmonella enterica subsp. enterica serovar Minnesota]EHN3991694.1 fimbrial protein [Salmonella enterica subsp. enterica serovar Minnesota]
MKRMTILLLAASLLPSCVLAWNTPGEDFSGELKLGGPVTSTRNPWVWKVGEGNTQINTKAVSVLRSGEQVIPVPLPAMTVLLGKTILTTPAGREGLAPQVTYGKETEGFALTWTAPGMASVTLPVTGEGNVRTGTFTFRMQAAGVLQTLFDSEGPVWLREMTVSSVSGLSRFSDAALRQVDGVYGAQTVADSGELRFKGAVPSRWHTSLAVSIEYR